MDEPAGIDPNVTEHARSKVSGPATGLIVVASIALVFLVAGLAFSVWLLASGTAGELQDPLAGTKQSQVLVRIAWNLLMQLTSVMIILGALRMKRLSDLRRAKTACVLALIPCTGPCMVLGIPFGIWGLVVLNDPKVRQAFPGEGR